MQTVIYCSQIESRLHSLRNTDIQVIEMMFLSYLYVHLLPSSYSPISSHQEVDPFFFLFNVFFLFLFLFFSSIFFFFPKKKLSTIGEILVAACGLNYPMAYGISYLIRD